MRYFILLFALAACSGGDDSNPSEPLCEPGRVESCPCSGGTDGVQSCAQDGSRWGVCACAEPGGMGAVCEEDGDCRNGFWCSLETCLEITDEIPCAGLPGECPTGFQCGNDGRCTDADLVGASGRCTTSVECMFGLECVDWMGVLRCCANPEAC